MNNLNDVIPKTDVPTKAEPPPRSTESGDLAVDNDILLLTDVPTKAEPPPRTDMFFSNRALLRSNLLDSFRLGIAIGLGWAIMFLIISIVESIGAGSVLDFYRLIYPDVVSEAYSAIVLGFALSAVYGFLFGLIVGMLYNSLIKRQMLENDGWETYA